MKLELDRTELSGILIVLESFFKVLRKWYWVRGEASIVTLPQLILKVRHSAFGRDPGFHARFHIFVVLVESYPKHTVFSSRIGCLTLLVFSKGHSQTP